MAFYRWYISDGAIFIVTLQGARLVPAIFDAHLVLETGAQVGDLGYRVVETLEKVPRNRDTRVNHVVHITHTMMSYCWK